MTGPERAYEERLMILKAAGEIKDYIYQPPSIWLDGKVRYTPDFRVDLPDGTVRMVEIKGCRRTKTRRIPRPYYRSRDSYLRWRWAASLHPEWSFIVAWQDGQTWREERP